MTFHETTCILNYIFYFSSEIILYLQGEENTSRVAIYEFYRLFTRDVSLSLLCTTCKTYQDISLEYRYIEYKMLFITALSTSSLYRSKIKINNSQFNIFLKLKFIILEWDTSKSHNIIAFGNFICKLKLFDNTVYLSF